VNVVVDRLIALWNSFALVISLFVTTVKPRQLLISLSHQAVPTNANATLAAISLYNGTPPILRSSGRYSISWVSTPRKKTTSMRLESLLTEYVHMADGFFSWGK